MKNLKNEHSDIPKQTLYSLKEDYINFQMAGGNIRNAKNIITSSMKICLMFHLSKYVYHLTVTYNKNCKIFYSKNQWSE